MSFFMENGENERVKLTKMALKWDCQIIFSCGGKFVCNKGQACYFEAKCAKHRIV